MQRRVLLIVAVVVIVLLVACAPAGRVYEKHPPDVVCTVSEDGKEKGCESVFKDVYANCDVGDHFDGNTCP